MARRLIASLFCKQYKTEAKVYIEGPSAEGWPARGLLVQYENGGYGGRPEFGAVIPNDWSEEDVMDLLLWPMKSPKAPYPAWEVPARVHGSPILFRWWAGEDADEALAPFRKK
jgi:hypothetical protein